MKKPWKNASDAITRRGSGSGYSGPSRSKTGAQSIRGRISEPIPIRSPLDEELRLKSTEIDVSSSKLQALGESAQFPEAGEGEEPSVSPKAKLRTTRSQRGVSPAASKTPVDVTCDGGEVFVPTPTESANPLRYSMISESTDVSRSSLGPHRKNSTLRGALGKLFNRRRRTDNRDTPSSNATPTSEAFKQLTGASMRTSEPKLPNPSVQKLQNLNARRRNSLPISEFDRALRSHSVRPKDVMAIESMRNSANIDFTHSHATLGRRYILSPSYPVADDENLAGLSPRPGAHRPKADHSVPTHRSSQSQKLLKHDDLRDAKRRSKSVSGVFSATDPQGRRRSDEIRYWRESYGLSGKTQMSPDPPEDKDIDLWRSQARDTLEQKPRSPIQPFVFGDIATMNEMAGMKITQAASIDMRIRSLEAKIQELETAMGGLRDKSPQGRATTTEGSKERSVSPKSTRVRLTDDWIEPGQRRLQPLSSTFSNRASTSTTRALGGPPAQSRDRSVPLTIDHYLTLMALIETERSSRQALEAQVRGLTRRLKEQSRSSQDTTTLLTINPHHHSVVHKGDEKPETSAFDQDTSEEENEGMSRKFIVGQEDSGIGHFHDVHDEDDDDDVDDEDRDEPRAVADHNNYTSSAFGQELDDVQLERRKGVRTLSLSQMTFDKRPIVNL